MLVEPAPAASSPPARESNRSLLYFLFMRAEQSGQNFETAHINPLDAVIDKALTVVGVDPTSVETFLSSHQKGARIAADSISLVRIGLTSVSLNAYEHGRAERNRTKMVAGLIGGAVGLSSDFVDGYIARKAHIDSSPRGRFVDAASDVIIRNMLRKSSLFSGNDFLDTARMGGEATVFVPAALDMIRGEFQSTALGQLKQGTDGFNAFLKAVAPLLPESWEMERRIKPVTDLARVAATGFAIRDGYDRARTLVHRIRK